MDNNKKDIFEEITDENTNRDGVMENPVEQMPKTPFYKKTMFWVLIVVVLGLVAAILFGNYGARNELVKYNNEQVLTLAEEFVKIDQSFSTLLKETDDASVACETVKKEIIPKMEELIKKANDISPKTDEIKNLHGIFKESFVKYKESMELLVLAIEKDDMEKYEECGKMYDEACRKFEEYIAKRDELRKEYNLEIEE